MPTSPTRYWGVFTPEGDLYINLVDKDSSVVMLFKDEAGACLYLATTNELLELDGHYVDEVGPLSFRRAQSLLAPYVEATPTGVYTINVCGIKEGEWPTTLEVIWDPKETVH